MTFITILYMLVGQQRIEQNRFLDDGQCDQARIEAIAGDINQGKPQNDYACISIPVK